MSSEYLQTNSYKWAMEILCDAKPSYASSEVILAYAIVVACYEAYPLNRSNDLKKHFFEYYRIQVQDPYRFQKIKKQASQQITKEISILSKEKELEQSPKRASADIQC